MADTIREQSAILALFADNTTGNISEQDLRDFVASAMSPKVKFTPEGGVAVKLVNKTGANSVVGSLVKAGTGVDESFILSATTEYGHCGVVYEGGVPDGSSCWVVVAGVAEVLVDDSQAVSRGDFIVSSTSTAGRVDVGSGGPGVVPDSEHFREVGHAITGCTAGTDKTFKLLLHWN